MNRAGERKGGKKSAFKGGQESGNTRPVVNDSHAFSQGSHVSAAANGLHASSSILSLRHT